LRTLQSRVDWNYAALTFHFLKGPPIDRSNPKIVIMPRYGPARRPTQPHQPRRMKMLRDTREEVSTLTPSDLTSAPRSKKPTKIASVLIKEGQLNSEERARRKKEGLC
ncbi:hypothetical protein VP01_10319g1, partial [Puccinia sorghi]